MTDEAGVADSARLPAAEEGVVARDGVVRPGGGDGDAEAIDHVAEPFDRPRAAHARTGQIDGNDNAVLGLCRSAELANPLCDRGRL